MRLLRDASDVLDYLHGRAPPVIHRDLKPSNVIRRPDGSFAFVDFGAVRDKLRPEGGSTIVGTFGYMAPEQFQGRALPASDVYAIGGDGARRCSRDASPRSLPHKGLAIDVRAALGDRGGGALARGAGADARSRPGPAAGADRAGARGPRATAAAARRSDRRPSDGQLRERDRRSPEGAGGGVRRAGLRIRGSRGRRAVPARTAGGEPRRDGTAGRASSARRPTGRCCARRARPSSAPAGARGRNRGARRGRGRGDRTRRTHRPPWPVALLLSLLFAAGNGGRGARHAGRGAGDPAPPVAPFFATRGLTAAAEAVREAGEDAIDGMARSRQWSLGPGPNPRRRRTPRRPRTPRPTGVRVAHDAAKVRVESGEAGESSDDAVEVDDEATARSARR